MSTEPHDARVLLQVAPEEYVTERTRLVKQAKADRDKPLADFYQSLKRPNLSLWAVLAAGSDGDSVRSLVAATTEVGVIQAGGGTPAALAKATKQRRTLVETLTDRAVAALAESDKSAPSRRAEIRALIDQLSRQPSATDSWIDGTLRDVPESALGFAAFTEMQVVEPTTARPPAKPQRARPTKKPAVTVNRDAVERAQRDADIAARDLADATKRVEAAKRAMQEAEAELRRAEKQHDKAAQLHARAAARLDAAQQD